MTIDASSIPLELRPVESARSSLSTVRNTVLALLVALVVLSIVGSIVLNPAMRWDSIVKFLVAPIIVQGLVTTIVITVLAALMGLAGGLLIALMRVSSNGLLQSAAVAYLSFFRAVPLLVQILFWYNLGTFFPQIGLGIPFTGIGIFGPTNEVLSPLVACLVAIGLNQAAYMGEIIRGGLLSVQPGQIEAATALGMTRSKVFARVIAPQAARSIVPPLGNDLINLLKATSLVSVVGVGDLMTRAQGIYASNYQVIPLLIVASIWYLALTALITIAQVLIEKRLSLSHRIEHGAAPSRWRLPRRNAGGEA